MLINLFVYFLLLYFYSFFLIRKGKHNQEMKKNRYICSSNFSFFSFFQKLYPTTKVVLERTKMRTFPVMWFRQRVIHQTISAGLKKVPWVCNACKSCNCWSTCFFHGMSVKFAEQSGTYWELFKQVYVGMKLM